MYVYIRVCLVGLDRSDGIGFGSREMRVGLVSVNAFCAHDTKVIDIRCEILK